MPVLLRTLEMLKDYRCATEREDVATRYREALEEIPGIAFPQVREPENCVLVGVRDGDDPWALAGLPLKLPRGRARKASPARRERDLVEQGRAVLAAEAAAIGAVKLDEAFAEAVRWILDCKGRVVVTGMGKSGLIGRKIAATFASTGTPAYFLHPAEGVHGDIGMVARGDVVLALSNSGETDEILAVVPPLKRLGIAIILLTGNPTSTLARQCEVVIDVGVAEEACPMNLAPTSSSTATLAMGDALAMALLVCAACGGGSSSAGSTESTAGLQ